MEELIVHTLSNIGIPAAICFYTLFEVKKSVDKLTDAITRLDSDVNKRISRLEEAVSDLQKYPRQ